MPFYNVCVCHVHMLVGVGTVNVTSVEDNSTHLTLSWEEPFRSEDVISLYYMVVLVNLDETDKQRKENTTDTSIQYNITDCGLYQLSITAFGSCKENNFTYETTAVTVNHSVVYDEGETCLVFLSLSTDGF